MSTMKNSPRNIEPREFSVSYFLVPGFSLLALSSAIEPLRSVNRLLGARRYRWNILAEEKGAVPAGNGLEIQAGFDLSDPPEADLTIVVASLDFENFSNKKLISHIRWLHRQGRMIGAISNGTFLLAPTGVLRGRHVTVHWEMLETFRRQFPDVDVSSELFCIDKTIYTAAGGASSMDMMLELIISREGDATAADVAEQFLHGAVRPSSEVQRRDLRWRHKLTDKRLEKVVKVMEQNHSAPVDIASLARIAEISERQLERLFLKQLDSTPSSFYLNMRLDRAQNRLLATTNSLEEIAETAGFSSQGHFSRAFKAWCGASPLAVRKRISRPRVGNIQKNVG